MCMAKKRYFRCSFFNDCIKSAILRYSFSWGKKCQTNKNSSHIALNISFRNCSLFKTSKFLHEFISIFLMQMCKVHSFKDLIKNCTSQVFSDTIQKCISSRITQLKGAQLKVLLQCKTVGMRENIMKLVKQIIIASLLFTFQNKAIQVVE